MCGDGSASPNLLPENAMRLWPPAAEPQNLEGCETGKAQPFRTSSGKAAIKQGFQICVETNGVRRWVLRFRVWECGLRSEISWQNNSFLLAYANWFPP